MMRPDLWEVRQAAADRRSALRSAFIRNDPQLSGVIAPFLVKQLLASNKIDVPRGMAEAYTYNGRFHWVEFCNKIEKELDTYMSKEGYALGSPRSPRNQVASPRRLPALLRAGPGPDVSFSMSPRASKTAGSPRMSASKDMAIAKLKSLSAEVDETINSAKSSANAVSHPWLLAMAARQSQATSPRLTTTLESTVLRKPKLFATRRKNMMIDGFVDDEEEDPAMAGGPAAAGGYGGGGGGAPTRKKITNRTTSMMTDKIADRFSDIKKAFKYVDVDGNGKLDRKEVERAMQLWNIPMEMKHIEELFAACDGDGDGQIDYNEFVDHLARDTVNPAAMGKRGMQSKEATGVDGQEYMDEALGHKKVHNIKMKQFEDLGENRFAGMQQEDARKVIAEMGKADEAKQLKDQAVLKISEHFSNMRKAFHYVDVDNSGTVDAKEIRRAMHMWGIDLSDEQLALIMAECDPDGNGQVDYDEFVDHLARDTVAPAAMGKRGMQSKDAMGVDAQEMLAEQLGHKTEAQKAKERAFYGRM